MPEAKLPQPYGLRIEIIRAGGFADEELLRLLQAGDAQALRNKVNERISWDSFLEYARTEWPAVREAVLHGYRFTFLTIGGLKDLLSIRFGKEEARDYSFDGAEIAGLRLTPGQFEELKNCLSANWCIIEQQLCPDQQESFIQVLLRHASTS